MLNLVNCVYFIKDSLNMAALQNLSVIRLLTAKRVLLETRIKINNHETMNAGKSNLRERGRHIVQWLEKRMPQI